MVYSRSCGQNVAIKVVIAAKAAIIIIQSDPGIVNVPAPWEFLVEITIYLTISSLGN